MAVAEVACYVFSPIWGRETMCGRLYARSIPAPWPWLFYHEISASEQGLRLIGNSYGGIDSVVVAHLMSLPAGGVIAVRRRELDPLNCFSVVRFEQFLALADYKPLGGRHRLFLPQSHWQQQLFLLPAGGFAPRLTLRTLAADPRQPELRPKPSARPPAPEQQPLF